MTTATKRKPARRTLTCEDIHPGTGNGKPAKVKAPQAPPTSTVRDGREFEAPLISITESPLNPRTHFDPAKLQQTADSLKKHGQLMPVLVWHPAGSPFYEIIDGARRYRSAKLARLKSIKVKLLDVSEEEAIELRGIANLEREDLTPIETARWYQQLLDRCGYTQTSLAKKLGKTQSDISQALALLKLPDDWQQRIITGAISPTHARHVAPWAERPNIMEALGRRFDKIDPADRPSVKDFEQLVHQVLRDCTKPATSGDYYGAAPITISKQLREELDVQTITNPWGRKEARAFNVKLWNQKAKEARKRKKEKATKAESNGPTTRLAKLQPPKTPDPQLLDAQWRTWYQFAIADELRIDSPLNVRLLLMLVDSHVYARRFTERLQERTGVNLNRYGDHSSYWQAMLALGDTDFDAFLVEALREMLTAPLGKYDYTSFDGEAFHPIAQAFGIDPHKDWRPSTEFLDLLSEEQLRKIPANEFLTPDTLETLGKGGLMERIIEHWPADQGIPKLLQLDVHKKAAKAAGAEPAAADQPQPKAKRRKAATA